MQSNVSSIQLNTHNQQNSDTWIEVIHARVSGKFYIRSFITLSNPNQSPILGRRHMAKKFGMDTAHGDHGARTYNGNLGQSFKGEGEAPALKLKPLTLLGCQRKRQIRLILRNLQTGESRYKRNLNSSRPLPSPVKTHRIDLRNNMWQKWGDIPAQSTPWRRL